MTQSSEDRAEEALVLEVRSLARKYARRRCPEPEDAEDLAQDVALEVLKNWHGGRLVLDGRPMKALIKGMVRRRIIDARRRRDAREARDLDFLYIEEARATEWMNPDVAYEASELSELEARLVGQLPPRRRKIVTLIRYEQRSYLAAASELHVSRSTVCAELSQARREFAALLAAYGIAS